MTDGDTRFAERYPRVWHVIEADGAGAWLNQTGLLPAAELQQDGNNRDGFRMVELATGCVAVVRPQLMADDRLVPTLGGVFAGQPQRWREHLNQHVFFWTDTRRRDAFARACVRLRGGEGRHPVTLVLDTAALLAQHGPCAYFATINTGSTVRAGARVRRDEHTLRRVADYRRGPVAELAIRGRVDLSGLTVLDPF